MNFLSHFLQLLVKSAPLGGLIALQGAWLSAARLWTGVGWGWSPALQSDGTARMGWMTNLPDSLSYSSWMEQARNGSPHFELLYTTSPHLAGYFNPVLWFAGSLSRVVGGAPTGWLNFIGFAAALLCTALIYAIALELELGRSAAFWSSAVAAFGAGWSWMAVLLSKLTGGEALRGADLRYMDLLPSSAMLVYPFHTIGFALIASLWWLVLRCEKKVIAPSAQPPPGVSPRWWVSIAVVGFLLAASRPYEPAAFLAIFGLYTLSSFVISRDFTAGWIRLRICVSLGIGICPPLLYSAWLSTQPVWRDFAAQSLQNTQPRMFWLIGFGGLWLLAALGLPTLLRGENSPRWFPAFWVLFVIFWLVVLDASQSKLAAGGGLALALAAGVGMAQIAARWNDTWRLGPIAVVSIGGLLAGPLSLFLIIHESATFPPYTTASILELAQALRPEEGKAIPTVLCELDVGAALPGIAGLRVVCGHWSLTDQYEKRREWLLEAGLQGNASLPRPLAQQFGRLRALVSNEHCDYLLISKERSVTAMVAQDPSFELLQTRGEWQVYRVAGR